jgi:hypothetical protein
MDGGNSQLETFYAYTPARALNTPKAVYREYKDYTYFYY